MKFGAFSLKFEAVLGSRGANYVNFITLLMCSYNEEEDWFVDFEVLLLIFG